MGIGHYYDSEGVTVYAKPFDGLPEYKDSISYLWDDARADLESDIWESLSPAWRVLSRDGRDTWRKDARAVFESGLHEITLHEDGGGYGYHYITVRPRQRLLDGYYLDEVRSLALARASLQRVASGIFDRLAERRELHMRATAWTSRPYRPAAAAAA